MRGEFSCMTPITHFVVNGDSFTYCQGLQNRINNGWPWLLAKHFKLPVVNLAIPGTGNDTIHRRTYEYCYLDKKNNNNPFFIIGWSQFWRREAWIEPNQYQFIGLPAKIKHRNNEFQTPFLKNHNDEDHVRRSLIFKSSLINLFDSINAPYLMSDYSSDTELIKRTKSTNHGLNKKIKDIESFCYNDKHITDFCKITENFSKTPCGHDGDQANQKLCKFLVKAIYKNYTDVTPVYGRKFLEINEFNKIMQ